MVYPNPLTQFHCCLFNSEWRIRLLKLLDVSGKGSCSILDEVKIPRAYNCKVSVLSLHPGMVISLFLKTVPIPKSESDYYERLPMPALWHSGIPHFCFLNIVTSLGCRNKCGMTVRFEVKKMSLWAISRRWKKATWNTPISPVMRCLNTWKTSLSFLASHATKKKIEREFLQSMESLKPTQLSGIVKRRIPQTATRVPTSSMKWR